MSMTATLLRRLLIVPIIACCVCLAAVAQGPLVTSRVRVLSPVNNAARTPLRGTHPAVVDKAAIGSRLSGGTQLQHLILVLKPSEEQEAVLHTLLDAQQDKNAPSFHKWLTPDTFSASFGVAQPDVARVTAWMQDSGLQVEQVSKGGRFVLFSGSVESVESAFQTEIHNVTVGGEAHISNTSDITVPDALAPVVHGVARLNDFVPKSSALQGKTVQIPRPGGDPNSGVMLPNASDPLYGSSATGTHYVAPGDVAAIYNATPLTSAGFDGTGTTIAIIARSNINLADVATFRGLFGLPAKTPIVTVVGPDPGINADSGEAYLDAEWAGAIATNATVNFIVSSASLLGGGIDQASLYAVDNNIGDIISMSYGGCETNNGASATAFWNSLWEQAAAQGQTAMVSSGDSGATGCTSSSATYGSGYGVNALGSSAYNVAVGGTMFVDYGPAQYWGTTTAIPYTSALGYIPEAALNQGKLTTTLLNSAATATTAGSGVFSTGGGISMYTARPSWQTGDNVPAAADPTAVSGTGIAAGSPITGLHRLVPDVSLISANGHDGTLFCAGGVCQVSATGTLANAGIVGGTSVATPVMASVQALINQKNGGRQGNANYYYYKLAASQYSASATACQSVNGTAAAPAVTLPASTCNFFDTVAGSNRIAASASDTVGTGFNAAPGFDVASGLGTPNIANLANNWKNVSFNATATTLSISPATGVTHGGAQTATIQVSPASGSGTPTGDVSILATTVNSGLTGNPQVFTLSSGSVTGALSGLPAGNYSVYAHYAGDVTYAPSNSVPVNVSIAKEASKITATPYSVTAAGAVNSATTSAYGAGELYLDTEVTGASADGTGNVPPNTGAPSGTVVYTINRNGSPLTPLTTTLDTYGTTYLIAGPPFTSFYLQPNYAMLPAGSYSVTAAYSGDGNFNANQVVANFTITQTASTQTLTTSTAQITSGANAVLNYTITTPTSATPATGTVSFTDTTTSSFLGTANVVNGAAVFTTNSITASGANTITAVYSGDPNYSPAASAPTTTVTVGTGTSPSVTASTTSTSLVVGSTISLRATLGTAASAASSVSFYDNGVLLGTVTVSNGATTTSLSVTKFTAGIHPITAQFAGTTTQPAAVSGVFNLTVTKNVTATALTVSPSSVFGSLTLSASISRTPTSTAAPVVGLTGSVTFYDGSTAGAVLGTISNLNFDPGNYSYYSGSTVVTNVAAGNHTIVAVYSGDANYATSTSGNEPINIAQQTPVITLTSPVITYSTSSVALTAQVAYTGGTAPTGAFTFTVDGGAPVPAVCTGSASPLTCSASYNSASLTGGTHILLATITADANFTTASRIGSITVNKYTPAVSLTSPTIVYGTTTVALSARINYAGLVAPTGAFTFSVDGGAPLATTCAGTYPVVCSANYTSSGLSAGNHTLSASLATDTNYAAVTTNGSITVTKQTPTVSVSSPTIAYGTATVGLSAQVVFAGGAAPTGAVSFSVDGGAPQAAACVGTTSPLTCTLSYNSSTLTGGGHTLTATVATDTNYAAAGGTGSITVTKQTPALTLTSPTIAYGTATVGLSAQVSFTGGAAPTGAVSFSVDGGASQAAACAGTTSPLTCTLSYNSSTLTGGGHTLSVSLATDANYAAVSNTTGSITVTKQTPALTLTSPTIAYGTATVGLSAQVGFTGNVAPTGAVSFSVDGGSALSAACVGTTSPLTCTVSYNSSALGAGGHTLSVSVATDTNYAAVSTSGSLTVTKVVTLTAVTTSVNSAPSAALVTFTATVSATGAPTPSGFVVFSNGTTTLATVALNNGVASYSTTSLNPTYTTVTATYQGNANYAVSSFAAAVPPTFTLTDAGLGSYSATVSQGYAALTTITLTPSATYSGTVTFSCTGLPANASCVFTPSPLVVAAGSGAQSVSLTVRSSTLVSANVLPASPTATRMALVFWLPGLLLAGIGARSKRMRGSNRIVLLSVLMLGLFGIAGLTGCGGSESHSLYTVTNAATGTYTVNVVASSSTYTQTMPVTFVIQ